MDAFYLVTQSRHKYRSVFGCFHLLGCGLLSATNASKHFLIG